MDGGASTYSASGLELLERGRHDDGIGAGEIGYTTANRKMDERKDVKFFKWRERKKGDEVE